MNRRALLGRLGAAGTLGAAAVAGCLGTGTGPDTDSPGGGDPSATDTDAPDDPTTETETGTETPKGTDAPDGDAAVIGDPADVAFPQMNRPHAVAFENAAGDSTTLDLSVAAEGRGAVWSRTVELAPGGSFDLRLVEPAHYTLRVARAGGDSGGGNGSDGTPDATVDVPLSHFDCNESRTTVTVTAEGVKTETLATEIACATPELVGTSFDAGEGTCGDPTDAADVRYDGEAVRVSGTVTMPDPCRSVSLSEATYDDGTSTLFLTVRVAAADPAATCVACVGVRDYEVTADFDADLPDRVVVRHAGADRPTETVTRAVRGGDPDAAA